MLLVTSAAALSAQTMYDGLKYSDINLYGTARSIALGNAMTAVGGDLGSIALNPAGSSVAGYSQFSLTQGVSYANTGADYSSIAGSDVFEPTYSTDKGRYTMPNIGFVMNMDTPASSSVRSVSVGMIVNTTNRSLDKMTAMGLNSTTSMTGAMAYAANGIPFTNMESGSAYDNYNWPTVLAYKSYMISGLDGSTDKYIGATEAIDGAGNIILGGPIQQRYVMQHTGSRNDLLFNVAANISDMFYIGFNLGCPIISYNEDIYQMEAADDPADFEQTVNGATTYFNSAAQTYYLETDGSGVYAQIGAIATLAGFRLGFSVKTPTYYTMRERWGYDAETIYSTFSQSASSNEGDYRYDFVTPFETNLGVAYTLGGFLLASADWGYVNYKNMKFRSADDDMYYSDEFDGVNDDINRYAGKAKQFRFGLEFKPLGVLALRYGYNSKVYDGYDGKDKTNSHAFGIGYSSNGSFFADFVVRSTKYPYQWYYPYDDYMYDDAGSLSVRSAEIGYSKSMLDCLLTVGWRF